MSISEKIRKSKDEIKDSQKMNVSCDIYNSIIELEKRKDDREFLMTIPINIVSSNENFFKETFSSLIDFDEEYLNNTKALIKRNNVRIDIEDIFHITKSTFTLGDLLAYSFKYSSIESLYKTFTDISNIEVFNNVEELTSIINDGFELEDVINNERPIDRNRIFKNLVEVYEIRNIICHDFLSATHKLVLAPEKLKEYLMDTFVFQELITILLSEKIFSKKFPLEYSERIELNSSLIEKMKKELNDLYNLLAKEFDTEEQYINLDEDIKAFESFLEIDSRYITSGFRDFDLQLLPLESSALEYKIKLIEQRIKNITDQINYSS